MNRDNYWEELLNEHGSALLLYARQWSNSIADAEDIVQKSFVRFWRSEYTRSENPAPYLYRIVRNTAIDLIRSRKRREIRERQVFEESDKAPMFEPGLEQEERHKEIEKAIAKLPEEQREVVVMKIWGDLTFKEIAETLGIPQNTAASRYRYALDALGRQLGDNHFYEL